MRNKEIKVGDKIWLYAPYMSRDKSGYTVKSVKKSKTLVTVVAEIEHPWKKGNRYEAVFYGHYNSRILSSYDKVWGRDEDCYTCDYNIIDKISIREDINIKLKQAGRTLLDFVDFIKDHNGTL